MSILTQKTISKKISLAGIGIHTGLNVQLDIDINSRAGNLSPNEYLKIAKALQ